MIKRLAYIVGISNTALLVVIVTGLFRGQITSGPAWAICLLLLPHVSAIILAALVENAGGSK